MSASGLLYFEVIEYPQGVACNKPGGTFGLRHRLFPTKQSRDYWLARFVPSYVRELGLIERRWHISTLADMVENGHAIIHSHYTGEPIP